MPVVPIRWSAQGLELLDQTRLPGEEVWVRPGSVEEVADAIRRLVVRGAPAVGVAAAFALAAEARGCALSAAGFRAHMEARAARLEAEAVAIQQEDLESSHRIGQLGAELIHEGDGVMTHCNAGALATAGYGTALGIFRAAWEAGVRFRVYARETRPLLQGSRLTAWELQKDGLDVVLVTDSMAAHLMKEGRIQRVITGADRVAANGDTANKIGTYGLAIVARYHRIPFHIAAPWSTVDLAIPDGDAIVIEERDPEEVTRLAGIPVAPPGTPARNPAFDVTPAGLITSIITDRGVVEAPYREGLARQAGIR